MSLDIYVPFSSFEVDDYQLSFFVEHEVFGFNVSVEVAAVMNELNYFKDIDEDSFGRKSKDGSFVFLENDVAGVLPLEVENSVDAGPFGHGYVFPESVVDLDDGTQSIWSILDHYWVRVSFRVTVEDCAVLWTLQFVLPDDRRDSFEVDAAFVVVGVTSFDSRLDYFLDGNYLGVAVVD